MKNKTYIGFSTLLGSNIIDDINFANKNSFNAISIDLSWKPNLDFSKEEIACMRNYSEMGNKIIIHLPFFTPTNSSIDLISEGLVKYFKKIIKFANNINSEILTFHSGYVEQIGINKTHENLINNLKKIMIYAKKYGIRLSMENDDKSSDYPMWNLNEINKIYERIPDLKFTFDIGHANTGDNNVLDYYNKLKKYIDVIHIHNNTGKDSHGGLMEGDIDYKKIIPIIKKTLKNPIFILELFPYEKIIKNREIFLEFLNK